VALGEKETESILSFCAGGRPARALTDKGQCVVLVGTAGQDLGAQRQGEQAPPEVRFPAATFEEALRAAADGGHLRRSCVDKQIAFWGRHAERPKDAISRVLMSELGAARGQILEREIIARVGRPLSDLSPAEMDDVATAAEVVLGTRMNALEAARMAKRVLDEARGALSQPPASPTTLFEIAKRIARLVHETQRERGETAVFLGSARTQFAAEVSDQRKETDRRLADFVSYAATAGSLPVAVESRVGSLRDLARAVAGLRAQADGGDASPYDVVDAYSALNARLLDVIDAIAADAPERLRVLSVAYTSLMWAKENTGRERAQLAVAFGLDRFGPGQIFTVGALFGAQESFLRLFTTVAPPEIVSELRERLAQSHLGEVRRLEELALSRLDGGFGVDPSHWYEAITRKVDLIDEVGSDLAALIAKRAGE
jgi:hypothetical protein